MKEDVRYKYAFFIKKDMDFLVWFPPTVYKAMTNNLNPDRIYIYACYEYDGVTVSPHKYKTVLLSFRTPNPPITLPFLSIALPLLFSSCATIFGKSSYPVAIDSNPTGATVSITDKKGKEVYKGASPATVAMWKLETPPIFATLRKETASTETPALKIVDIASIPIALKEKLVRIK